MGVRENGPQCHLILLWVEFRWRGVFLPAPPIGGLLLVIIIRSGLASVHCLLIHKEEGNEWSSQDGELPDRLQFTRMHANFGQNKNVSQMLRWLQFAPIQSFATTRAFAALCPYFGQRRAPTNCWVAHTLATLQFILECLGFSSIKCIAVSKASSNFSSLEYRQRFRLKRRGISLSPTLCGLLVMLNA